MLLVETHPGSQSTPAIQNLVSLDFAEVDHFCAGSGWAAGEPLAFPRIYSERGGSAAGYMVVIVGGCLRGARRPAHGVVTPVLYCSATRYWT